MAKGARKGAAADSAAAPRVFTRQQVADLAAEGKHVYMFKGGVYDVDPAELMHPGTPGGSGGGRQRRPAAGRRAAGRLLACWRQAASATRYTVAVWGTARVRPLTYPSPCVVPLQEVAR